MAQSSKHPTSRTAAKTVVLYMGWGEDAIFHREAVAPTERQVNELLRIFLQNGEAWLTRRDTSTPSSKPKTSLGASTLQNSTAIGQASSSLTLLQSLVEELSASNAEDVEAIVRMMSREEKEYYNSQPMESKAKIVERIVAIRRMEGFSIPLRFRVLASELPVELKRRIAQKLEKQQDVMASGDTVKYATWVEGLIALPLNAYVIPAAQPAAEIRQRLHDASDYLDNVIYGHKGAKQAILERLFQWICHPWVPQRPLGLQGCPGNGKSSLIREGLAVIMNRPYSFVALGGSFDSSYLLGHGYTYEGSVCGRIAETLTSARCMNPLIFFDEVDKCSGTPKGEEIVNVLVHLTDTTQSTHFRDRYFASVDLDLSRSLLVFAFNNASSVSPVLLDRMQVVATDAFDASSQMKILKQYLLPRVLKEYGQPVDFLSLSQEALQEAVQVCGQGGVRLLRSVLEQTVCKVSILHETASDAFMYPLRVGEIMKVGLKAYELRGGLLRLVDEAMAGKSERQAVPPGMYS